MKDKSPAPNGFNESATTNSRTVPVSVPPPKLYAFSPVSARIEPEASADDGTTVVPGTSGVAVRGETPTTNNAAARKTPQFIQPFAETVFNLLTRPSC